MKKEWQVCELEDSRKQFIEFSVAAVPKTWNFKRDNVWWCYWPKTNVLKKIKSCEEPNPNDGKWATFKCRILMNGEKFQTYKKAVEAEKIGQNFSILKSETESEVDENDCDSTMHFDVLNEVDENNCDSTMNFEVSSFSDEENDMNEEAILGNDTYEFNKAVAKGFHAKNAVINQDAQFELFSSDEDILDSSDDAGNSIVSAKSDDVGQFKSYGSETSDADSTISEKCDYDIQFKANASNIFTSTLLGVVERLPKNDNLPTFENDRFVSKASEIETKVSSFLMSIQKDFHDLKEIGKLNMNKQKLEPASKSAAITLDQVHERVNEAFSNRVRYAANNETFSQCLQPDPPENIRIDVNNEPACDDTTFNKTFSLSALPAHLEKNDIQIDEHNKPTSDRNENEMKNTQDLQLNSEKFGTNISICNAVVNTFEGSSENAVIADAPILQEIEPLQQENHSQNIQPTVENLNQAIRLPLDDIVEWEPNENLLEQKVLEEALIEHLSPFDDEDETSYFNRCIGLLFSNDFLIDYITWKPEKGRALIKNSNILFCWKESYGKKFTVDIDDKAFKDNIRRVKSAKRAARKAQEKRKLNCKGKQARLNIK